MSCALDLSNLGDQIIRTQIISNGTDKYVSPAGIERITLPFGATYNIKLTKGRIVKNTKSVFLFETLRNNLCINYSFTPSNTDETLEISRFFQWIAWVRVSGSLFSWYLLIQLITAAIQIQ